MNEKELKIHFNAPLKEVDTESHTYGCRQNNPDICGNNELDGVCLCKQGWNLPKTNSCMKKTVPEARRLSR